MSLFDFTFVIALLLLGFGKEGPGSPESWDSSAEKGQLPVISLPLNCQSIPQWSEAL